MGNRIHYALHTIMDAKAADGVGNTMLVGQYETVSVHIATASSANLTIKCQGSVVDREDEPTFSSAASVSNVRDYVQIIDLQNGATIDGDTGIAFTGSDDVRLFEINVNALTHLNFIISSRVAGAVTIKAVGAN